MRYLLLTFLLFTSIAQAKTIKVAVIDTGFDSHYKSKVTLCPDGHKDLTDSSEGIEDDHGHGTHISGLIEKYAKGSDYCQVILKSYSKKMRHNAMPAYEKALAEAIRLNVDIINISANGDEHTDKEKALFQRALAKGILILVAAGNDGKDLNKKCSAYPACYDSRIIVVGSRAANGKISEKSNYGNIVWRYEFGEDVESINGTMTGTSQATAISTGKVVARKNERYKSNCCSLPKGKGK